MGSNKNLEDIVKLIVKAGESISFGKLNEGAKSLRKLIRDMNFYTTCGDVELLAAVARLEVKLYSKMITSMSMRMSFKYESLLEIQTKNLKKLTEKLYNAVTKYNYFLKKLQQHKVKYEPPSFFEDKINPPKWWDN